MATRDDSKTVLFVCTGNTCRSPMAEGLLRAALSDTQNDIEVGSAGVAAMPGQGASRETRQILKDRHADLECFKSRQINEVLLSQSDLIIAMTGDHAALVKRFFPDCAERVKLLCDMIPDGEGLAGADVPDPIGMGADAYQEVAEVIELAIPKIISEVEKCN